MPSWFEMLLFFLCSVFLNMFWCWGSCGLVGRNFVVCLLFLFVEIDFMFCFGFSKTLGVLGPSDLEL